MGGNTRSRTHFDYRIKGAFKSINFQLYTTTTIITMTKAVTIIQDRILHKTLTQLITVNISVIPSPSIPPCHDLQIDDHHPVDHHTPDIDKSCAASFSISPCLRKNTSIVTTVFKNCASLVTKMFLQLWHNFE